MASQKQIFLVALLLTIALGCHASKLCRMRKDCPPCRFGVPLCLDGKCTCTDKTTQNEDIAAPGSNACKVREDCPPCPIGMVPLCIKGKCICL